MWLVGARIFGYAHEAQSKTLCLWGFGDMERWNGLERMAKGVQFYVARRNIRKTRNAGDTRELDRASMFVKQTFNNAQLGTVKNPLLPSLPVYLERACENDPPPGYAFPFRAHVINPTRFGRILQA